MRLSVNPEYMDFQILLTGVAKIPARNIEAVVKQAEPGPALKPLQGGGLLELRNIHMHRMADLSRFRVHAIRTAPIFSVCARRWKRNPRTQWRDLAAGPFRRLPAACFLKVAMKVVDSASTRSGQRLPGARKGGHHTPRKVPADGERPEKEGRVTR
jgi:hypothetical protein